MVFATLLVVVFIVIYMPLPSQFRSVLSSEYMTVKLGGILLQLGTYNLHVTPAHCTWLHLVQLGVKFLMHGSKLDKDSIG